MGYLTGDKAAAAAGFEAALAADPKVVSAHLLAALSIDADEDLPRAVSPPRTADHDA